MSQILHPSGRGSLYGSKTPKKLPKVPKVGSRKPSAVLRSLCYFPFIGNLLDNFPQDCRLDRPQLRDEPNGSVPVQKVFDLREPSERPELYRLGPVCASIRLDGVDETVLVRVPLTLPVQRSTSKQRVASPFTHSPIQYEPVLQKLNVPFYSPFPALGHTRP
ncbi:MAG: hypothetical protein JWM11_8111 [Planctomycetaceae bacterium]|nr:hypothetical protein [Planctomycetaceae bacterium]